MRVGPVTGRLDVRTGKVDDPCLRVIHRWLNDFLHD